MLDYLQEGLGAENIRKLARKEHTELGEWLGLVEKIQNPVDAGELRGVCIREFESTPDHPGLFLARAVAESMCSDGIQEQTRDELMNSLRACGDFGIPDREVGLAVEGMVELAIARAPKLKWPLVAAVTGLSKRLDGIRRGALEVVRERVGKLGDESCVTEVASSFLRDAADEMKQVIDGFDD